MIAARGSFRSVASLFLAALLLSLGCAGATRGPFEGGVDPIRVSDGLGRGDAAREASLRLVLQGLEADQAGQTDRARGSYERAVHVDSTNPFAYLALARHQLDGVAPGDALSFLEQAAALFEAEDMRRPEVLVHLLGIRGAAYRATGRTERAEELLTRARRMSPRVWNDGRLSALELR